MPEQIHHNYQDSSGPVFTIAVPYARLTDATPTDHNPCEITSLVAGDRTCGVIVTTDARDSIAIVNVAPAVCHNFDVRNVLTYAANVEDTWGPINVGDVIYYDASATMPAGVYLSTSPLNNLGVANTKYGRVQCITSEAAALYPKGAAIASTQACQIQQFGAGS